MSEWFKMRLWMRGDEIGFEMGWFWIAFIVALVWWL